MSFWNKLSSTTKKEYSELLIELVELNNDKTWLEYFHNLRLGHRLPGGGMGSLNDWGPNYTDEVQHVWFNFLYQITHKLLTEKKEHHFITENYSIKRRNDLIVLKCSNCGLKFQHPNMFEYTLAMFYYFKNFSKFTSNNRLTDFINPNFSYNNLEAILMRESLEFEYKKADIILFNFLKNNRICSKCNTELETDHLHFDLKLKENNLFELNEKKPT